MKSFFPEAVSYNRFVELESRAFFPLMFFLNFRAFGRCTGITFVDSTMIPVCHNLRRYVNKVFKDIATDGKGAIGWCHGFKLHLACNDRGGALRLYSLERMLVTGIRKRSMCWLNACMASCSQTRDISRKIFLMPCSKMASSWSPALG